MARLVVARAVLAAFLLGVGSVGLASGFVGFVFVPAKVGPVSGAVLFEVGGGLLLLAGVLLAFRSFAPEEGPMPSVPAHVSFSQRQAQPLVAPPRATPRPGAEKKPGLSQIDEEIREVTRKINRAGVMLATGKLSGEGYARYVEALKQQRGQLERERVKKEFRTS